MTGSVAVIPEIPLENYPGSRSLKIINKELDPA
jgi:hypothetical protein